MMRIHGFDWDRRNIAHIARHNVQDYEVEEAILFDNPLCSKVGDDRYMAHGVTQDGRYLFIIFLVLEGGIIRVITARDMSEREKYNYRRRK